MNLPLLWICFGIVVVSTAATKWLPACPVQCDCGQGIEGYEVVCPGRPPHNSTLQVNVKPKEYMKISCTPFLPEQGNFEMLQGLVVGPVSRVTVKMCNLSDSFSGLLDKLKASQVQSFTVSYSNLTSGLDRSQFTSLKNITSLSMTQSGILDLPEDLFQDLNNLTNIDLRENEFELPERIFQNLSKLITLELGGNNITNLVSGVFKDLGRLRLLNLWKNKLENISESAFTNLNSLRSLGLQSNYLIRLPDGIFAPLESLRILNLSRNKLLSLPEGLFMKTRQLERLDLSENPGISIPPSLLSNLSNLTEVKLGVNNLTSLPANLLWGSSSLLTLDLSRNKLTELPDTLFKDAGSLNLLDISFNKIHNLPNNIFSSLTKLKTLRLTDNQLSIITESAFVGLEALEELKLDKNQLSHIDPQAFRQLKQLKTLDLSNNYLTFQSDSDFPFSNNMSPLSHCVGLEKLYLANNSLENIFFDWRASMTRLTVLDLQYNNITFVQEADLLPVADNLVIYLNFNQITDIQLFQLELLVRAQPPNSLGKHVKVYLDDNPLNCDCHIYPLLRYREGKLTPEVRATIELKTDNLRCSSPAEAFNVSISKFNSQKLQCRLGQTEMNGSECPESCTCWARPEDRAFIVDCSNAGLSSAPEYLPQPLHFNYTEVHLERNRLSALPNASQEGYNVVAKIYASHNKIARLKSANLPPNLEVLELENNNLTHMDASTLQRLWNETKLQRISLFNNPWECDCDARDLLNFLQTRFKQVEHLTNMTCVDGRALAQLSADDLCPLPAMLIIVSSLSIAVLGIIIGTMAALYYRYQREVKVWLFAHHLCLWFVTEEELDKDKHYDAFVSYSHQDEDFVVNHLVPGLESGPTPFKLCLHFRDWIAGEWIPNQIARSVEDSRRTMVILSPNFLESVWGRMEFRAAHSQALSEGRARVIVVLYGEVGPLEGLDPELKAYLSMNTYVKWGDPWFWDKLRYSLPHPPQLMKRTGMAARPPDLRVKTTFDDKLELEPTTPSATTPPATILIDPMIHANGHIIPLSNGHAKLIAENGHLNGYVKSI